MFLGSRSDPELLLNTCTHVVVTAVVYTYRCKLNIEV